MNSEKTDAENAPVDTPVNGEEAATPPPADADATPEDSAPEEDPTAALMAENADLRAKVDRVVRALADSENARRRAEQESRDRARYAAAPLARALMPVADNLRRALDAAPQGLDAVEGGGGFLTGVEMTARQLRDALAAVGVEAVSPAPGDRFDYALHQAMSEAEDTGHPAGTIAHVAQEGYRLHDRLLRPAMVIVAKGEAGQQETERDETG